MALGSVKRQETVVAATSGFTPLAKSLKRRLIVCVDGETKCGKTHFTLTAPGPVYVQNLDNGLEGVADKFVGKQVIQVADYTKDLVLPEEVNALEGQAYLEAVANQCNALWTRYKNDMSVALASARTLVWDTADESWELLRLARFGKLDGVKAHHYGPLNREYKGMIDAAYSSDCNLIMLHKMADEYVNDKNSGRRKRVGFKNAAFASQVYVRCLRDANNSFAIEVLDCRANPEINGLQLPNDFLGLALAVFPDTKEAEWT